MKNLLFITLLFSTTAFTNINLICDESYYFFPDLEERVLLDVDSTYSTVFRTKFSKNLLKVEVQFHTDLKESESSYKFGLSDNGYIYNHNVSRTTGTYQYVELFEQKTPVCKKVEAIEFQDAKNKLEEYSQKVKDKRKI